MTRVRPLIVASAILGFAFTFGCGRSNKAGLDFDMDGGAGDGGLGASGGTSGNGIGAGGNGTGVGTGGASGSSGNGNGRGNGNGNGAGGSAGGGGPGTGGSAGGGPGTGGATGTGGTAGAGTAGTSGAGGSASYGCKVNPSACSDGKDNDGDGLIDAADPECSGPCDNDEGSFATGIPGDNVDACKQDCFFDGNSGMGNDGCEWNLKCDPANPGAHAAKTCEYQPNYKNCPTTQSAQCTKSCGKITPNGCDCFGCCAVLVDGKEVSVLLTPECKASSFGDPNLCPRCTQQTSCINPCDKCEICVGHPMPDPSCNLPPPGTMIPPPSGNPGTGGMSGTSGNPGTGGASGTSGNPGTGGASGTSGNPGTGGAGGGGTGQPPPTPCPAGVTYCGNNPSSCPGGTYCLTGCCLIP